MKLFILIFLSHLDLFSLLEGSCDFNFSALRSPQLGDVWFYEEPRHLQ